MVSLPGTSELEGASTRMSPVGSACGSQKNLSLHLNAEQQDPVSRATQQYLEVLKKNYMIWNFHTRTGLCDFESLSQ